MIERLQYNLFLNADLHVGSGIGLPGYVDEWIVRDDDGFAYIPASEIKGQVRQSCADLIYYLERTEQLVCQGQQAWQWSQEDREPSPTKYCQSHDEPCVLCALFGSPIIQGSLWFSPAEYLEDYRRAIQEIDKYQQLQLPQRDSVSSAHASIDRLTRRAQEKHLFNLEVLRTKQILRGSIHLTQSLRVKAAEDSALSDAKLIAWLIAALLFTRRIGGRRRRGWGKCFFLLAENDRDNELALQTLEKYFGPREA